ncbi:hypothetical protein F4781DRAFT_414460 [Annulohypoxylon bovei var. microspora]|nr:hypothetical protein F4781DRAFT_414460 [Annulohypoxylon bovei var. microspora]
MQCKACLNGTPCQNEAEERSYCSLHYTQERALYHFYKANEHEFEALKSSMQYHERQHQTLATAHRYLSLAICARVLHSEWFFTNDICLGHQERIRILEGDRGLAEYTILTTGYNLRVPKQHDKKIMTELMNATQTFGVDEAIGMEMGDLISELPAIEILSEDEPGTVSLASYMERLKASVEW